MQNQKLQRLSLLTLLMVAFTFSASFGQFDIQRLQLRVGYNLHNTHAKRFNHLIDEFNTERYLLETQTNMGSLNLAHGVTVGANYEVVDDIILHAVFKNKHQGVKAQYINSEWYRHFLFRSNTVELGLSYVFKENKWFRHSAGAGILAGELGVYTDWSESPKRRKNKEMLHIASSAVIGLSLSYEAQFKLASFASIFMRPVFQYSLNSYVRNLSDFFNPQMDESGQFQYEAAGHDDKYDSGALNGIGIEGGFVFQLGK